MLRQIEAQNICDTKLKVFRRKDSNVSLYGEGWKTCFSKSEQFLARCYYDEKRIQISIHHLNSTGILDFEKTVLHEIAHALVGPGHGHDEVWINKALEIGLKDPKSCVTGRMNSEAGRAIQPAESKPKRTFNRVDSECPICHKKAVESSTCILNHIKWTKLKCGHLVKADTIKSSGFDFNAWESTTGKKPFPYQIDGIKFLEASGGRALIADEPGLGKTIQAIGFALAHKEEVTPILWVCKTTLKLQAFKEFLDWAGPEFAGQIITSSRNFIMPGMKLYIISMDLLRNMPEAKMKEIGAKLVVADEIQHFKNPDSTRTAELRKLVTNSEYFIPLSGTPWKNRGSEYFSVLNMLDPIRFSSFDNFKSRWVETYTDQRTFKTKEGGIRNIPAFKEYTKDLVIRRMRDEVLPDLPKINRQIRYIDMEDLYKASYEREEEKIFQFIKQAFIGDKPNMQAIASEIMKLKHITGLAKCQVAVEDTIEFLDETNEESKITLFHHHIDVGNFIQDGDAAGTYTGIDKWLVENGLNKSLRLYGGRSTDERNDVIQKFKDNPKNRVLIASTLASGEGLNIQFCQNAMMVERQWNPANEEQAELRFSRPLSFNDYPAYLQVALFNEDKTPKLTSVRVPYLIADGTIDSMLTEIVERKRTFFRKSMNDKDAEIQWNENEIMTQLAEMIIKKRAGRK